jgi:hypothetical protein
MIATVLLVMATAVGYMRSDIQNGIALGIGIAIGVGILGSIADRNPTN